VNDWDRVPGEPVLWYERFDLYRLAGPGRGLDATYRLVSGKSGRAGAAWWKNAERWHWQDRAEAWDAEERVKLHAAEEERRRAAREERLRLLGEARAAVWQGLDNANLAELSKEEARGMLGTLRMFFFEALRGERLEMGEPTEIVGDLDVVQFRADDLAKAQDELREWREKRRESSG